MSVAGAFYPDKKEDIFSSFEYFNDLISSQFEDRLFDEKPKALIVPHAGYIYSGFSANLAYRNVDQSPKRVVVIGPSHRVSFSGISLKEYSFYETPLGDIKADNEYINLLKSKFEFVSIEHEEHSTEVQFPFIKHYFPDAKLVEIIYGQDADLEELIKEVLETKNTLLLVSTDLSHFYNQEKANALDKRFISAVETLDVDLIKSSEACGMQGVVSLVNVIQKTALHVKSVDYRTSGDITGNKESVVGYYSAVVY